MKLVRNERFKVLGTEKEDNEKLRNKSKEKLENINDMLEVETFSITVITNRRNKKENELSFENEDQLKDFIKNKFNPDDIMKLFSIKPDNKKDELENIISKQKKDIDELQEQNNLLEKNLKKKEDEITKIINENKNLKDKIEQLEQKNIEENIENSNKQETIIEKKEKC